jgi:hypothetical protein
VCVYIYICIHINTYRVQDKVEGEMTDTHYDGVL